MEINRHKVVYDFILWAEENLDERHDSRGLHLYGYHIGQGYSFKNYPTTDQNECCFTVWDRLEEHYVISFDKHMFANMLTKEKDVFQAMIDKVEMYKDIEKENSLERNEMFDYLIDNIPKKENNKGYIYDSVGGKHEMNLKDFLNEETYPITKSRYKKVNAIEIINKIRGDKHE